MTNKINIMTNNKPRQLICGYQLSDKQKKDFDYIDSREIDNHDFVIYKNNVYDVEEFTRVDDNSKHFKEWHGYSSDSFFSGVLIKYCEDNDYVVMGWYCQ